MNHTQYSTAVKSQTDYAKSFKAIELVARGRVRKADGGYTVESTQRPGYFFQVETARRTSQWQCNCPSKRQGGLCVHILAAYKASDKAQRADA